MTSASSSTAGNSDASRLAPLDGLRAIAILAVMAFHYTIRWTPPHAARDLYPYHGYFNSWPLLDYGWAGVELFFVVSGFVICMTLERCAGPWDFFRRRLARLWPAMLACAAITLVVAAFGPNEWKVGPWSVLASILFIDPPLFGSWFHLKGLGWVDGVYWTLWIEVRFYIMAALVYALFRRHFLAVLTGVMLVSFVAGLRIGPYPHRTLAWLLLLPTFLPYFVFGVGAYRLSLAPRRPKAETIVALSASAAAILAGGWLSFQYPAGGPGPFAIVNLMIMAPFLAFALRRAWMRPFGWRPLAKLGEASYSLYLIHSVVGIVLIRQLSRVMPWPLAFALASAAMIALAFALFRWVEGPGKRLILNLTAPAAAWRAHFPRLSRLRRAAPFPSANG